MNFTATLPQERLAKHSIEWSLVPLTLPLIARHHYLIFLGLTGHKDHSDRFPREESLSHHFATVDLYFGSGSELNHMPFGHDVKIEVHEVISCCMPSTFLCPVPLPIVIRTPLTTDKTTDISFASK
jgi:hypothetical protein